MRRSDCDIDKATKHARTPGIMTIDNICGCKHTQNAPSGPRPDTTKTYMLLTVFMVVRWLLLPLSTVLGSQVTITKEDSTVV